MRRQNRILLAVLAAGTVTSVTHAQVVISQVYGGSNVAGATYNADYVELFNTTNAPVDLSTWSIQYAAATGTSWTRLNLVGSIPANGYYLIRTINAGTNGAALPVAPDATGTTPNLSGTTGKVALVNNQITITSGTACPVGGGFGVVDFVGYGTANCFEGTAVAPAPSTTTAIFRGSGGCTDSNNNNVDFVTATPLPRNSGSPINVCTTDPDLSVTVAATPNPQYVGSGDVTYTINVANTGASPAANVTLSFPVPAGFSAVSSSPTGTLALGTYTINLGSIPATTIVPVTINATPTTEGTYSVTFTTATSTTEPNTSNNTANASSLVLLGADSVDLKISQVYPGGGSSAGSSSYKKDFIELYNRGATPISLDGRSLQYQSETGTTWSRVNLPSGVTLAPGQYYLAAVGTAGTAGADLVAPDFTTTSLSLAAAGGKVALVNSQVTFGTGCDPLGALVIDFVAWGDAATCAEGAPLPFSGAPNRAVYRELDGCSDSDNNITDLTEQGPSPRGTETTILCGTARPNLTLGIFGGDCQVPQGAGTLIFNVSVTNNGNLAAADSVATITLPAGATPTVATPGAGSASIAGQDVTWNIGSLAGGSGASVLIVADVSGAGFLDTTASVSTSTFEVNQGDNSATQRNYVSTPRTVKVAEVLLTTVASAPIAKRQITTAGGATGNLTGAEAIGALFSSPDGSKFVTRVDTDALANAGDQLVVFTTGVTPTGSAVVESGPATSIVGSNPATLDAVSAINNAGEVAFSGILAGQPITSDKFVAKKGTGAAVMIAQEGSAAPGLGSVTIGNTLLAQSIDNAGNVLFGSAALGGTVTANNAYLGLNDGSGGSSFALKGADAPTATPPLLANTYLAFDLSSFDKVNGRSGDGAQSLITGTLNNATANDVSITVNGDVKIQEGAVIPGSSFAANVTSTAAAHMGGDGNWYAYGSNVGTNTNDWAVRNGVVVGAAGTPAYTGATENWSDTAPLTPGSTGGYAALFFGATGLGSTYVLAGVTDFADGFSNGVVATATASVLREGDAVDLNGNGLDDDNAVINTFRDDRFVVGADGYLYAVVSVRSKNVCGSPAVVDIGQALIRVSLAGTPAGCNLADITEVGGTEEFPGNPDGQLTVDDLILFVNLFSAGTNCPGTAPCNRADVTGIGGSGAAPDGELTVDDLIEFVNAFSSGC